MKKRLMLITAFSPLVGERVELEYENKEVAKEKNPHLRDFKEIRYINKFINICWRCKGKGRIIKINIQGEHKRTFCKCLVCNGKGVIEE